jgi:hypothetical protein
MKFFKKITNFKGGKAEKEVGLAVSSVAVISAVAVSKPGAASNVTVAVGNPVVMPDGQDSDSVAHSAHNAASKEKQNDSQVSDSHVTRRGAKESLVASHEQDFDDQVNSIDEDEEYRKAMEENIYLREKNSLLLQLVSQ